MGSSFATNSSARPALPLTPVIRGRDTGAMFRARIRRHPIPHDREGGRATVAALAPPPEVAPLIEGVAGCSPFLAAGMAKERDWLAEVWDAPPEASLDRLLAEVAAIPDDPSAEMRRIKRRAGLLVGLAEVGGVWPVMEAAAAWTRVADACVRRALEHGLARHARGPVDGDGGLVAIAMGKMGAGELNYSSDVDLVLLFDETRYDPGDYATARAALLKVARTAMACLSDQTADGYVFRTDLRLRPDPASTPIVLSMEAAERYYEALGRTWERAAWIKARACAGAVAAGEGFVARLAPFVWRRNLDYAVIEEVDEMRRRIREHRGLGGPLEVAGHDVKLGAGGIREIEFAAQTQQIVAGGRDASLRVRGTLPALDRLVTAGHLPATERDVLASAYRHLRAVEHRLQMVGDAQTHRVPRDPDGLDRLARFMGNGDTDAFARDLHDRLAAVDAITAPRFAPPRPMREAVAIEGAEAATDRWATYPALRSARARSIFARLRPALMGGLARAARPAEALAAFDAFLRGLPAGVQVLSLFEANPRLVDLVADICATAPDLARHLSRHPAVLDAVLDGTFLAPLPEVWDAPEAEGDFEAGLDVLRRWHREAHFRIGVHLLRGLAAPEAAGDAYATLAEATLGAAWRLAEAETARRHGRVPGLRLAGLGMGSLGVGRLTRTLGSRPRRPPRRRGAGRDLRRAAARSPPANGLHASHRCSSPRSPCRRGRAGSTRSTSGCAPPAGKDPSPRRCPPGAATWPKRRGNGSTWRSPARAPSRATARCATRWRRRAGLSCRTAASLRGTSWPPSWRCARVSPLPGGRAAVWRCSRDRAGCATSSWPRRRTRSSRARSHAVSTASSHGPAGSTPRHAGRWPLPMP